MTAELSLKTFRSSKPIDREAECLFPHFSPTPKVLSISRKTLVPRRLAIAELRTSQAHELDAASPNEASA